MLFVDGLERLGRDEKIWLMAQINALTSTNLVMDGVEKSARAVKDIAVDQVARATRRALPSRSPRIEEWRQDFDWDPEVINRKVAAEIEALSELADAQLDSELHLQLRRIANVNSEADCDEIAEGVILRAARSLGISVEEYGSLEDVEAAVFVACVAKQIDLLLELVGEMQADEAESAAAKLGEELESLAPDEIAAVCEAIGIESISEEAVAAGLRFCRAVPMAQMVCDDFGYASTKFLVSLGKAVGFALGCAFLPGVIGGVDRFMACALSPFIAVLSGRAALATSDRMLYDELARFLIVIGHGVVIEDRRNDWRQALS